MRATLVHVLIAVALCRTVAIAGTPSRYNTNGARRGDKLNVHIVCHSHDDAGWLKTVDQYHYGSEQDIQVAGVQNIIDTMIAALQADPNRKFSFAEMAFWSRWWSQQTPATHKAVKKLVAAGQLEFMNGGYVQHDEAGAHYVAMIDQTTFGHEFLSSTLGYIPTIGWQVDPFGHSSTAAHIAAAAGFDALYFGRADYQDMDRRKAALEMEMVWRGSASVGPQSDIFTGNFPSGNYSPPPGFCWEWAVCHDPPIMDDPNLDEYNVQDRVNQLVKWAEWVSSVTKGNDIMLQFGTDFTYANAHVWYRNIDKLIHHVNADGRINLLYSTPATYTAAKHSYNATWPLKCDDFFPYADNSNSYWTGYFTSRAAAKGFSRQCTSYMNTARQLVALSSLHSAAADARSSGTAAKAAAAEPGRAAKEVLCCDPREPFQPCCRRVVPPAQDDTLIDDDVDGDEEEQRSGGVQRVPDGSGGRPFDPPAWGEPVRKLTEAVALTQHHDSITGTAKQAVANDYNKRLHDGLLQAEGVVNKNLAALLHATSSAGLSSEDAVQLEQCLLRNVSICTASVQMTQPGELFQDSGMAVVLYNPLAGSRSHLVRLPVASEGPFCVQGPHGEAVTAQVVPVSASTAGLQQLLSQVSFIGKDDLARSTSLHELVFNTQLPAMGYAVYTVYGTGPPAGLGASCKAAVLSTLRSLEPQSQPSGAMHGAPAHAAEEARASYPKRPLHSGAEGAVAEAGFADGILLGYDTSTGELAKFKDARTGLDVDISHTFMWYGDRVKDRHEPSGAYIARPDGLHPVTQQPVAVEVLEGPLLVEVRQQFSDWVALSSRIVRGSSHVEMEWTVGPFPWRADLPTMEAVSIFNASSSIASGAEMWTDANGREMLRRIRDYRYTWDLQMHEPIASNYYPITAAAAIRDSQTTLAVVTDRAQGAASLGSGLLEVMVHRKTHWDDWRGVGEELNETMCGCRSQQCPHCPGLVVRGTHLLAITPAGGDTPTLRELMHEHNDPPVVAIAPASMLPGADGTAAVRHWSALEDSGGSMPPALHLLTYQLHSAHPLGIDLLLRIAHKYQDGEHDTLARPAGVDLARLLPAGRKACHVEELLLTGVKPAAEAQRRRWAHEKQPIGGSPAALCGSSKGGSSEPRLQRRGAENDEFIAVIRPMEIATFGIKLSDAAGCCGSQCATAAASK